MPSTETWIRELLGQFSPELFAAAYPRVDAVEIEAQELWSVRSR